MKLFDSFPLFFVPRSLDTVSALSSLQCARQRAVEQVATGEGFEGAVDPLRLQRLQANLHQKMYTSDMKRVDDELKELEENVETLRADVINRRIKVRHCFLFLSPMRVPNDSRFQRPCFSSILNKRRRR